MYDEGNRSVRDGLRKRGTGSERSPYRQGAWNQRIYSDCNSEETGDNPAMKKALWLIFRAINKKRLIALKKAHRAFLLSLILVYPFEEDKPDQGIQNGEAGKDSPGFGEIFLCIGKVWILQLGSGIVADLFLHIRQLHDCL